MVDGSKTTLSTGAGSFSEILEKDMEHLADTIFYAAVIITTTSSISIDAALFDKPTINIAFDGWEKRPFWKSVRRKFSKYHAHYQYIVKSGGVSIAWTFDELVAAINRYLEHPELDREGRARIVSEQCYKHDGQSGKRIAGSLLNFMEAREYISMALAL